MIVKVGYHRDITTNNMIYIVEIVKVSVGSLIVMVRGFSSKWPIHESWLESASPLKKGIH